MMTAKTIVDKLMSRKLAVAIGAVVIQMTASGLTPTKQIIIGAIAAVYIIAQTLLDHAEIKAEFRKTRVIIDDALNEIDKALGPSEPPPVAVTVNTTTIEK